MTSGPGRLVLVVVSPRMPAGMLSWPAWTELRAAPQVQVGAAGAPHVPFLLDAGVQVRDDSAQHDTAQHDQAAHLHDRALAGQHVVALVDGDAEAALVAALGALVDRQRQVRLEVVYGSYDPPGARLLDVVAVMDRLRSPGGCPWDAEQTHASLKRFLLEEAYEAYEALEDGDSTALREELGDVLLQVVFHARLAEEGARPWSVDDVAGALVDKLVRRHPHVFAGASADDLQGSWDRLKAAEKGRASVTEGVPLGQPALALAAKLQSRGSRAGAPVPDYDGLGGELWALVARCRAAGLDPEEQLRAVARGYATRLAALEQSLASQGRTLADAGPAELGTALGG